MGNMTYYYCPNGAPAGTAMGSVARKLEKLRS